MDCSKGIWKWMHSLWSDSSYASLFCMIVWDRSELVYTSWKQYCKETFFLHLTVWVLATVCCIHEKVCMHTYNCMNVNASSKISNQMVFILKTISKIFLSGFFLWGYKIKFFERIILCSLRMHLLIENV